MPLVYIYLSFAQFTARRLGFLRSPLRMQISDCLEQALLHQSSHATDVFFKSRSGSVFQCPEKKSLIEVYHQQPPRLPIPAIARDDNYESDSSPVRPSLLNKSSCTSSDDDSPPIYDNSRGLARQDILDVHDVEQIEKVSALLIAWRPWADTHGKKETRHRFRIWSVSPPSYQIWLHFDGPVVVSYVK